MKIGIMTFWESKNNYGQILQLFALQKALIKLGHTPFLIKYKRIGKPHKESILKKIFSPEVFTKIYNKLNNTHKKSLINDGNRKFDDFKSRNIIFGSNEYDSFDCLINNPPEADIYLAGSDQVWNNSFNVSAEAFLLGFGNKKVKRVAYAASFGQKELSEDTEKMFCRYFPSFDSISVREKSGVNICNKLGDDKTQWVLDPTLLFNKKEWEDILNLKAFDKKENIKQIFIYTLGNSLIKDKNKFKNYAKKQNDCNVIHAAANNDYSGDVAPSIEEWVNYIRTSNLVITTSFHGMVFCIINNVNFIILLNSGDAKGMNERIESLLDRLGLTKHIMDGFNKTKFDYLYSKEIEWGPINKEIEAWKKESEFFLKNI
ncbi:Polysaccharide pyruvyl transferase [Lutibacter agarilyticus]|uniref:Polysaccharide pyruvyl transferase n=1 Tax=Lutibacter agarilyticus TaxID=1109740 RepID=A0A238WU27_9FLAO|nr:polysaccharide pyruvyl transferase family protein [Lutibacter agarilyticus]SNR49928.1 Polysaccharide pyruvyl transferase [Lutibacter agarilyticus]